MHLYIQIHAYIVHFYEEMAIISIDKGMEGEKIFGNRNIMM